MGRRASAPALTPEVTRVDRSRESGLSREVREAFETLPVEELEAPGRDVS